MVSFRVPLWIPAAFLAPALLGLLVFRLDGKGVPLILIGDRRIDGFNPSVYDDALKHAGIAPRTVAQSR